MGRVAGGGGGRAGPGGPVPAHQLPQQHRRPRLQADGRHGPGEALRQVRPLDGLGGLVGDGVVTTHAPRSAHVSAGSSSRSRAWLPSGGPTTKPAARRRGVSIMRCSSSVPAASGGRSGPSSPTPPWHQEGSEEAAGGGGPGGLGSSGDKQAAGSPRTGSRGGAADLLPSLCGWLADRGSPALLLLLLLGGASLTDRVDRKGTRRPATVQASEPAI